MESNYSKMVNKAVETINKGYTVEFVNTTEFINSDNKLRFHFVNHRQAIEDIMSRLDKKTSLYFDHRIINTTKLREFSQKPEIKEQYKNWREVFYPPELLLDYARLYLKELGYVMREDRVYHKLDSFPSALKKFLASEKGKNAFMEFVKENDLIDHGLLEDLIIYNLQNKNEKQIPVSHRLL